MKKLLLYAAFAAMATTASAASSDYFKVMYEGHEVADGSMIYCNNVLAGGLPGEDNYSADVTFMSLEGEQLLLLSVNPDTEQPEYDGGSWGMPQVCEADGNCFPPSEYYFGEMDEAGFMWMIEATEVLDDAEPVYIVTAMVAYGERDDYEIEDDSLMTFRIKYSKNIDAKVDSLNSDSNEAPVYYNLLGKRIENPSNGVFIVKQGKKVTKQIFR